MLNNKMASRLVTIPKPSVMEVAIIHNTEINLFIIKLINLKLINKNQQLSIIKDHNKITKPKIVKIN